MSLTTSDFPQADEIISVGLVANAVSDGYHTDEEIENYLPGLHSNNRQGRYYRHAAQLLGLIQNSNNYAILTPIGMQFLNCQTEQSRLVFLANRMQQTPLFESALRYIQLHAPNDQQLRDWLLNAYDNAGGSQETAERRYKTFIRWLTDVGLI